MSQSNKKLRADFLDYMREHDAWPPQTKIETWLQSADEGMRHGIFSQMIHGVPIAPECVVKVVKYLTAEASGKLHVHAATTFKNYLKSKGIASEEQHSDWSLAARLLESDEVDHLQRGFRGVWEALRGKRVVDRFVQACANESKVAEAIRWMYVWVARNLEHVQSPATIDEEIEAAERHMNIKLEEYQKRAVTWWNFDRWTVVLARGKCTETGMNIVLPLREHAYESIRSGERMSYDIYPSDLQRPSRSLLFEGTAERAPDLGGNDGNTTRNTLIGMLSQHAVLSHDTRNYAEKPLRVLTFGGTGRNLRRTASFGFKPTGVTMPGTKIPLVEKVFKWPFHRDDILFAAGLSLLGMHANEMLAPPYDKRISDAARPQQTQ
ncbi:MAG: hypothetical protein U1D30_10950 [Planctomycetota bacterium]